MYDRIDELLTEKLGDLAQEFSVRGFELAVSVMISGQ